MKIRKSVAAAGVAAVCAIGLIGSAVPANAYSSTNFYNSPGSCWGGVVWGGSSYYSGSTSSYASTTEQNNPCLQYQVSAAVRWNPTNSVVGARKYGWNYVVASYGAYDSAWRYGGSHSFGGAWGNS